METKVVLITGGTGKVGVKLVESFLATNNIVITVTRSKENLIKLKEKLSRDYVKRFFGIILNLEEEGAMNELNSWLEENMLFPSVVINNARSLNYLGLEDGLTSRANWIGEFTMDVVVPYELSISMAYHPNTRLKRIINISSMYGIVAPNPNLYEDFMNESPINYGVCKAALIHLSKELAVRLADKGIDVNTVSYGGIEGRVNKDFIKRYASLSPQGRMLRENDVVGSVQFLASEASIGMTGQNLVVDGGWTIW